MRKVAVLVTLTLTLTLVLAACATSSMPTARHTSSTLIAWISTPAPPTTSTTTTTVPLAPAPFCAPLSLKTRLGTPLVGSDATAYITNVGKTTCRLSGYAAVMLVTRDGEHIQVSLRHRPQNPADYAVTTSRAVNLVPGATGGLLLGEYSCGTAYVPVASTTTTGGRPAGPTSMIIIHLPHDEGSLRTYAFSGCPPTTPYWDSELGALIPPPVQPLTLASTSISSPDIVKAAGVLHYTVTLSNPRLQLGSLARCPGYTEGLDYAGSVHQHSYLLNCKAIEQLGPKQPVTLAMEIRVPRLSGTQAATLTWRLDQASAYPTLELALTISSNPPPGTIHMTTSGTIVGDTTTTTTGHA